VSDETNQKLLLDNLYKDWYKIRPSSLWELEVWIKRDNVEDLPIPFKVLNAEDIVSLGSIEKK